MGFDSLKPGKNALKNEQSTGLLGSEVMFLDIAPDSLCYKLFTEAMTTGKLGNSGISLIELFEQEQPEEVEVYVDSTPVYVYSVAPTFSNLLVGSEHRLSIAIPICVDLHTNRYNVFEPINLVKMRGEKESIDYYQLSSYISYARGLVVGTAEKLAAAEGTGVYEMLSEIAKTVVHEIVEEFKGKPPILTRIITYYVLRDLVGYDILDPILADRKHLEDLIIPRPGIEPKVAARILDRVYMLTVSGAKLEEPYLNRLIEKLVTLSGGMVSMLNPLASRMLPHHHRLTVSYAREVSVNGPIIVVRMFPEPWNILRLLSVRGIHPLMAAVLGATIMLKKSIIVAGVMGSGKTSMLNSLISFIPKDSTIVTIEDTPELILPHCYWIRHVTREAIGGEERGAITMFDLMKHALRESADYVIIGEVRGAEGRIWAQAIATGHGGLTTFHAETADTVLARLHADPINVELSLLMALHGIVMMRKMRDGRRLAREFHNVFVEPASNTSRSIRFMTLIEPHIHKARIEDGSPFNGYMLRIHIGDNVVNVAESLFSMKEGKLKIIYPVLDLHNDMLSQQLSVFEESEVPKVVEVAYANAKTVAKLFRSIMEDEKVLHQLPLLAHMREEGIDSLFLENFERLYKLLQLLDIALNIVKARGGEAFRMLREMLDYRTAATVIWSIEKEENLEKLRDVVAGYSNNGEEVAATVQFVEQLQDYFRSLEQMYERWLC